MSPRDVLATCGKNFVGCPSPRNFFHENLYLKSNFEYPRNFISLKIIRPTVSEHTANYEMNKSGAYPSKHDRDWCISEQTYSFVQNLSQEKHLVLEKSYTHCEVC